MKNSKYIQIKPDILLEYIYDDTFLSNDTYIITKNLLNNTLSYSVKDNTNGNKNSYSNSYNIIDPVTLSVGKRNDTKYNFLEHKEYVQTLPIRYDRVRLHFPINYNFATNAGVYLRVAILNNDGELINLVQYYFDKQDQDRFNSEIELANPSLSINGVSWGKFIELSFPSPKELSLQLESSQPKNNSINKNLTNNVGIDLNAPIMIEAASLEDKIVDSIDNTITYFLETPYQTSVPLTPDFESLGLMIEESEDGDWFDIYGVYNNSISEFNEWIKRSKTIGKRFYVDYKITLFEENIKSKTLNINVERDFNQPVEYRPIIKYSSTTASIEVIMEIIDRVDDSKITRRAYFGMKSKDVAKYSRSLVKINTESSTNPKIYNISSSNNLDTIFSNNSPGIANSNNTKKVNKIIKVPYSELVNINNVVAKSDNSLINGEDWKGYGKLKLVISPFDNIIQFNLAKQVTNKVDRMNLLEMGDIKLYFKNYDIEKYYGLYRTSNSVDLERGVVVFKVSRNDINDIRRIYQSGINMFYIVSEIGNNLSEIYNGTFIMSDSIDYVDNIAIDFDNENDDVQIRRDNRQEFAIVTRRLVNENSSTENNAINNTLSDATIASNNIFRNATSSGNISNIDLSSARSINIIRRG